MNSRSYCICNYDEASQALNFKGGNSSELKHTTPVTQCDQSKSFEIILMEMGSNKYLTFQKEETKCSAVLIGSFYVVLVGLVLTNITQTGLELMTVFLP